jgi:hypothetical protein
MGVPGPVVGGTFAFIGLAIGASFIALWLKRTKKLSKDNVQCVARGILRVVRSTHHSCDNV